MKRSTEDAVFERQAQICKAFASPVRLRLLDILGSGPVMAAELQTQLRISKANLSQHIAVLRSAGAIATRREGRMLACSLAIPEIKHACRLIRAVLRAQVKNGSRMKV
jgi:DNA-binding transcriptional ArsR family regulator